MYNFAFETENNYRENVMEIFFIHLFTPRLSNKNLI